MRERLDSDGLERVVCRHVLEYLRRREGCAVLRGVLDDEASEGGVDEKITHLVVAEQPDAWCLVILVIRDHDIVRPHLKQVALCHFDLATITSPY